MSQVIGRPWVRHAREVIPIAKASGIVSGGPQQSNATGCQLSVRPMTDAEEDPDQPARYHVAKK